MNNFIELSNLTKTFVAKKNVKVLNSSFAKIGNNAVRVMGSS